MKTAHSMDEYLAVIESGIRSRFPEGKPKQVVIVGAGMAGLVAGYELKRAGHTPIIPEAQHRAGGSNPFCRRARFTASCMEPGGH